METIVDLEGASASRISYVALLRRYLGFQRPLEARLVAAALVHELPFELVLRAPRLEQDLRDLDVEPSTIAAVPAPACSCIPALDSLEELAGCLYVIEGAALGGRVIANHLRTRLGLTGAGVQFFAGTGDVRERWGRVLSWLESLDSRGADRDAIESSARATFDAFGRWMERGA